MRRIAFARLALAGAAITLAAFLINDAAREHSRPRSIWFPDMPGEADEAEERAAWELARLRDPATGRIPDEITMREQAFAAKLPGANGDVMAKRADGSGWEWIARGPYNVGGRTRALAIDAGDPRTILAGGVAGGMWRSSDGGGTWQRTTLAAQHPSVTCIAQDVRAGHRDVWYYGTGERNGNSAESDFGGYYGDGIFKSTDNGRSWRQLASTLSGTPQRFDSIFDYVWRLAVDPSNASQDELYAAAAGAILRSTDGGESWTRVLGGMQPRYADVAVTAGGVVYAAIGGGGSENERGLWRSEDGVSWTKIAPENWYQGSQRIVIAPAPSNPSVVYFLADSPGNGKQVTNARGDEWHTLWRYRYISGDGAGAGGAWEERTQNLPGNDGTYGGLRSQGSYDLTIAVKPDDESVLFIGGTNLYRSADAFATAGKTAWIGGYRNDGFGYDFHYKNHHPDQHALAFDPTDPSTLYSGNDGGVQRTDDAMAQKVGWQPLNNGYVTGQFYSVAIDQATSGDNTIVGGLQDNGTWRTGSLAPEVPWTNLAGADGGFCAIADGRAAYYGSVQGGTVFRGVLDTAGVIVAFTRVDPAGASGYLFIAPFALDPVENDVMYLAAGSDLWRNSSLATIPFTLEPTAVNWQVVGKVNGGAVISAIGVSKASPAHRIYIGTSSGDVLRMEDGGQSGPTRVTGAGFPQNGYVSSIAVDPLDGNRAIAVFSNYSVVSLFATSDGGASWSAVAGNLEEHPDGSGNGPSCRWAEILHRPDGDIYFVGTSTGLYSTRKLDGDATVWTQEGAGTIGNVVVDMVKARQSDGMVAVATHANGVFSAMVGTLGVEREERIGMIGSIDAIAPNPIRDEGTIRYTIGGAMPVDVRMALFDLTGREVRRVAEGRMEPGEHAARLERGALADLPSGRYLCGLQVSGVTVMTRPVDVVR